MEQSTPTGASKKQAGDLRRCLLMFIAFVYLFVGVAHEMSCFDQAVASPVGIEKVSNSSGHDSSPAELTLCDHCPTCIPALVPAPVVADALGGLPSSITMSVASFFAADHAWFDSPPPKSLT
ncbi:hypothetical protein SR870_19190 [Rhodopseudomonas palustris]|uniref:hypothetical protein n=1 Tax=Rhodopseudomonas palustris TaxID=1076 RepID=UPI002ACECB30|nr:hypothetical protein [Rhodopseudomonas palustris]WQG98792.1 hypothetical protein SR870_19190 [Rhodopseudomonas palustris]